MRSRTRGGKEGDPGFPAAEGGETSLFPFTIILLDANRYTTFQRVMRCSLLTLLCSCPNSTIFAEMYPSEIPSEDSSDVGVRGLWAEVIAPCPLKHICNAHGWETGEVCMFKKEAD